MAFRFALSLQSCMLAAIFGLLAASEMNVEGCQEGICGSSLIMRDATLVRGHGHNSKEECSSGDKVKDYMEARATQLAANTPANRQAVLDFYASNGQIFIEGVAGVVPDFTANGAHEIEGYLNEAVEIGGIANGSHKTIPGGVPGEGNSRIVYQRAKKFGSWWVVKVEFVFNAQCELSNVLVARADEDACLPSAQADVVKSYLEARTDQLKEDTAATRRVVMDLYADSAKYSHPGLEGVVIKNGKEEIEAYLSEDLKIENIDSGAHATIEGGAPGVGVHGYPNRILYVSANKYGAFFDVKAEFFFDNDCKIKEVRVGLAS